MRKVLCALIALILACGPLQGAPAVPDEPARVPLITLTAADFLHTTGRAGSHGWEADQLVHRPGFLAAGPTPAVLLSPGVYRASLRLRRGQYPNGGFLKGAEFVVRFELRDAENDRPFVSRAIDASELPVPNRYDDRWIDFSVAPGRDRLVCPVVYWPGGVNTEVESVTFFRIPIDPPEAMAARADRLAERVRRNHLENGFVVSRKKDGRPDETGDATTYTGFYAAALAWRLSVAPDDQTEGDLENALNAIHNAIKGSEDHPILARFVDADGVPKPDSPSRDVYAAFFFACATAYPRIHNEALRAQIRNDVRRLAKRLLADGLVVRGGRDTVMASFAPHFTTEEIRHGLDRFLANKNDVRRVTKTLRDAGRFMPFEEMWPGIKALTKALDRRDEKELLRLAVPTADGLVSLMGRVIQVLREKGRRDLIGPSLNRPEPATLRLAALLSSCLRKLPPAVDGRRFRQPSDLRVLASNALLALHIVRTAAVITGDSTFEDYYRNNLFAQDALLKTALDWDGVEDDLLRAVAGNAAAARDRRGYLSLLAAYNLYQLETNPSVKEDYRQILRRQAAAARFDDNPLIDAVAAACGAGGDTASLLTALTEYPDSPDGFGDTFWVRNGRKIAEKFGGGFDAGASCEPLPVALRPRDSFLWQRNTHRVVGDLENAYPGADYVFLYWLARRHGLVPGPAAPVTARQP